MLSDRLHKAAALRYWYTFAAATALLLCFALRGINTMLGQSYAYNALSAFYASGLAATRHMNPYGFYPLVPVVQPFPNAPVVHDVNLSPPCLLPIFELMARFPLRSCVPVWTLISAALFVAAVILISQGGDRQARKVVWLLVSQFTFDTLRIGEDYSLFLFLSCLMWYLIARHRSTAAYITAGVLIALKPNLGLWLVLLLAGGYWRAAATATVTAGVLSAIPLLRYGPGVYIEWLRASGLVPHWVFPLDISLIGLSTRMGVRQVGVAAAMALALALVVYTRRYRPVQTGLAGLAVCAGVLCSPLGWYHYAFLAAPFFAIEEHWGKLQTWAAFLVWLPEMFEQSLILRGKACVLLLSLPHLAGVSLMLYWFVRSGMRSAQCENADAQNDGPAASYETAGLANA